MPRAERDFTRRLDGDSTGHHRIRVRFTNDGNVVVLFTVQYETLLDGIWRPVVRYDTSHGEAHRDTYDPSGRQIEKLWLGVTEPPFNDLFTATYEDLRRTWRRHYHAFLNRDRN